MTQPNLGARKLREWRAAQNLTLTKAARVVDCEPSTLHHLEHGKRPSIKTAVRLRDAAGIAVEDWMDIDSAQEADTPAV